MLRVLVLAAACAAGCTTMSAAAPEGHHHGQGPHDWNSVYAQGTGFNVNPNALLASTVEGLTPGTALDIGMGQGRNAVFLASRGWQVTGVDTSDEGIRIANEAAKQAKVQLTTVVADVNAYDLGTSKFDLVALLYVGGADLADRITRALKPHGVVVVEYFHHDMETQFHHSMGAFDTGELEKLFPSFEVLRSEVVDDVADFGQTKSKLVRFVARKR